MSHQTFSFLLHTNGSKAFYGFVFFSTLCSYSFHWFLTKDNGIYTYRYLWTIKYRWVHISFYVASLLGVIYYFPFFIDYISWFLIAVIATFLYSAPKVPHRYFRGLRKIAYGKTIFLAAVWMYVTTILPFIVSEKSWIPVYSAFIVHRFFLIYAICILFDYRDKESDIRSGIKSLITFLPDMAIKRLFYTSVLLSFIGALCMYAYGPLNIAILLVPVMAVGVIFPYAIIRFTAGMVYYFMLDGFMALSAGLMWVRSI